MSVRIARKVVVYSTPSAYRKYFLHGYCKKLSSSIKSIRKRVTFLAHVIKKYIKIQNILESVYNPHIKAVAPIMDKLEPGITT